MHTTYIASVHTITSQKILRCMVTSLICFLQNAINPLCVFWSFNDTGSEGWSSSGLSVGSFDESTGTVICISNHLTSFAVLVDVSYPIPVDTDQDGVDDSMVSSTAEIFMIYAKLCTVYTVLMFTPWPSMVYYRKRINGKYIFITESAPTDISADIL